MAKCAYCGEKLSFSELVNGYHSECHSKNQEERIKANKSDAKEVNDEAESSVSLNQNVADLFISVNTFLYILGFVFIAIFGLSFGSNGILIVLLGSLILFVSWGAFAIIAEIYKNLKEINAKIKSPDKD